MANSNIQLIESSEFSGNPNECYRFTYMGLNYNYTSSDHDIMLSVDGKQEVFYSVFIKRSEIKPASENTLTVYLELSNSIVTLFKGSPPEKENVRLRIFRLHGQDTLTFDCIFDGDVSQCQFEEAQAELTVTIENYLKCEIPRGKLQYYCNNSIYDTKCTLDKSQYMVTCNIVSVSGLTLYAEELKGYRDNYFTNGIMQLDNNTRLIEYSSSDGYITVRYPFETSAMSGIFTVYPGCDGLFTTCASKFHNTDNFTGVPYTPPTDSEKNPVGGGTYWIDKKVITRDSDGFVGEISF